MDFWEAIQIVLVLAREGVINEQLMDPERQRQLEAIAKIEAHDTLSLEWATSKVEIHNKLFPSDQWQLVSELV